MSLNVSGWRIIEMTREQLPKSIQTWMTWLEDSIVSESKIHPDTITIREGWDESICISFDVEYFEFLKAIEEFPTLEYYLYSARVSVETVTFQFILMSCDEYYKKIGF